MCQRQSLDLPVALQGAYRKVRFVLLCTTAISHELVDHVVPFVQSRRADQHGKHKEILVEVLVSCDPRHCSTLRQGLTVKVCLEGDTVANHVPFEPFCLAVVEENHERHRDQSDRDAGHDQLSNLALEALVHFLRQQAPKKQVSRVLPEIGDVVLKHLSCRVVCRQLRCGCQDHALR